MIFATIAMIIDNVIGTASPVTGYGIIYGLYALVMFIPGLAVTVRRLHDVGKSGWMYLIVLIPLIGVIWLIVLVVTDSSPGENRYGISPKDVIS